MQIYNKQQEQKKPIRYSGLCKIPFRIVFFKFHSRGYIVYETCICRRAIFMQIVLKNMQLLLWYKFIVSFMLNHWHLNYMAFIIHFQHPNLRYIASIV